MRSLLAAALALAAAPAFGLSCKAPNFAETFNHIAGVPEVYSLAYGELTPQGAVPDYVEGTPRTVTMTFDGRLLGGRGFGAQTQLDVVVTTECLASWCGPLPTTGTPMLAFLEHRGEARHLTAHACPQNTHLSPSLGRVTAIRACMRNGACGADEIAAFDLN